MEDLLRLADACCPLKESGLADDILRLDDVVKARCPDGTPGQRKLLRETLEMNRNRTTEEMLEEGVKIGPSIAEVFPNMYHYANANTLMKYAEPMGDGTWVLDKNIKGRYLGLEDLASPEDARSGYQLPKAVEIEDALTRGRKMRHKHCGCCFAP